MKLEVLGVDDWPLVDEKPGQFQKYYNQSEISYIVDGEGMIDFVDGQIVFESGDLVTVMPETTCTWNITKAIQRHYSNG